MKIIISPAKQMNHDAEEPGYAHLPVFLREAQQLLEYLRGLSYEALKKLLCTNDRIAALNFERCRVMDLRQGLSPALLAYDGIQYKYMAPPGVERPSFEAIRRCLSALISIMWKTTCAYYPVVTESCGLLTESSPTALKCRRS